MNHVDEFIRAAREEQCLTWREIGEELLNNGFLRDSTSRQAEEYARNCYRRHVRGEDSNRSRKRAAKLHAEEKERIKRIKLEGSTSNLIPTFFDPGYDVKHIRIGLVSDTHFGSKSAQYSALNDFYKRCASLGIHDIYHCGDIDDGSETMHPGVMYEHHAVGATEHLKNIVAHYPRVEGITTHFITGNHDNSHMKNSGLIIGEEIALQRPDMHYLGRDVAIVNLSPKCTMELRHPGDGTAYSVSYKPQKIAAAYTGDRKPNILCIGHYHKALYMIERNIHIIMASSFCGTTPFMMSKNIASAVGGWVLDIDIKDDGSIDRVTPTYFPVYREREDDWRNLAQ